jgi:hypothetical protein
LDRLLKWYLNTKIRRKDFIWWDKSNALKEHFREIVSDGLKDRDETLSGAAVALFLERAIRKLNRAFKRARGKNALYHTYFINTVAKYRLSAYGFVIPEKFRQRPLPVYLEAQVRMLKIEENIQRAGKLYLDVKRSRLYDRHIRMYRLNASLKNESWYIGRSRAFPPGWLENESIWLHMQYKYLAELFRQKLYRQFFEEFRRSLVCFQKAEVYGRSIFENSSFLVSSAHADKNLWGRGFVGRLSGSTVELLNIFLWMAAGIKPFYLENDQLCLRFQPCLTKEFFTRSAREGFPRDIFAFTFLGQTRVVYHNPRRRDILPRMNASRIVLDRSLTLQGPSLGPAYAPGVRENRFKRIDVYYD